jgi:hypothetical protein
MKKKVWYSRIDFRPNPADPAKGVINLGFLLEFTTEEYWVVGMVILAALDKAAMATIDTVSRQLLENREDVIEREVRQILSQAERPGQVLPLLAAANPWSLHIGAPEELAIWIKSDTTDASVEKIAEEYAFSVFMTNQTRAKAAAPGERSVVRSAVQVNVPEYVPAPWILPPTCVIRPLLHWQ